METDKQKKRNKIDMINILYKILNKVNSSILNLIKFIEFNIKQLLKLFIFFDK